MVSHFIYTININKFYEYPSDDCLANFENVDNYLNILKKTGFSKI